VSDGQSIRRNFLRLAIGLLVLLAIGTLGYRFVEGWGWLDALYMTVIAFSTVGFQEVGTLDPWGRAFTMLVILGGLLLLAMLSATVTSVLVRRDLLPGVRERLERKRIRELAMHTILCGAGDTGKTVIREFMQAQRPLVVIDPDESVLLPLRELYPELLMIPGDATKDEVLVQANIEQARGLITTLREDADNLYVVLTARALNPKLNIVSRAVDPHAERKMYTAGASHVISPNLTEGLRMAAMMLRPHVVSFLDVMMRDDDLAVRLEERRVPEDSPVCGRTLKDAAIPRQTDMMVLAIRKPDDGDSGRLIYNPQGTTVLEAGDVLLVLGDPARLERLDRLLAS